MNNWLREGLRVFSGSFIGISKSKFVKTWVRSEKIWVFGGKPFFSSMTKTFTSLREDFCGRICEEKTFLHSILRRLGLRW